jgi:phage-related protein
MRRSIVFYQTASGECPAQDFLDSLPSQQAQKITWVLKLVEELDFIPSSYFKKLTGTKEIWECRIASGSNAYRIFCFFYKNNIVVLTHGISKKSRKTPASEILRAESCRRDFLERRSK